MNTIERKALDKFFDGLTAKVWLAKERLHGAHLLTELNAVYRELKNH